MKTVFTTLAALLATLCTVSTALGGNFEPAADPAPKDASTASVIEPSQPYYSPLTANEAPWITKLQEDITVSVGQQVVIMFQYAGTPMPKVDAIYHNGVEITNSDSI